MIKWDHHSDKEIQKQTREQRTTRTGSLALETQLLGELSWTCVERFREKRFPPSLSSSWDLLDAEPGSAQDPRGAAKACKGVGLSHASLHGYSHDPIEAISHTVSFRPVLKSRNTIHEPQSRFKIVDVLSVHFLNRVTDKNLSLFHLVPSHLFPQIYMKNPSPAICWAG